MDKDLMFYCIPQEAYMRTTNCKNLRKRPVGKAPAGAQPMLRACERCTMYPLVDGLKVPTVPIKDYLAGSRPEVLDMQAGSVRKLLEATAARKAAV